MKLQPKIPHVEVDGCVLPAAPVGLGIANDILAAYEDSVKAHTVKVPTDDPVKRVRPPGRVGKSH